MPRFVLKNQNEEPKRSVQLSLSFFFFFYFFFLNASVCVGRPWKTKPSVQLFMRRVVHLVLVFHETHIFHRKIWVSWTSQLRTTALKHSDCLYDLLLSIVIKGNKINQQYLVKSLSSKKSERHLIYHGWWSRRSCICG